MHSTLLHPGKRKDDAIDMEVWSDDTHQQCHQDSMELTQPARSVSLDSSESDVETNNDHDDANDNDDVESPFTLLEKQLLKQSDNSHAPSVLPVVQIRSCQQPTVPTLSPEDWPLCDDIDDDDDNDAVDVSENDGNHNHKNSDNKLRKKSPGTWSEQENQYKTRTNDTFPLHKVILKELERSRKRLQTSMDAPPSMMHNRSRVVAPLTESSATNALDSIVGTRPQHWVTTPARKLNVTVRQALHAVPTWTTPHSKQPLQRQQQQQQQGAVVRRARSFLENTPRMSAIPTTTKSFTPAFLGKQLVGDIDAELIQNRQPREPWYKRTNPEPSREPRGKSGTKRKATGPLMQRYTKLRAAMNADIVRLQSKMSMEDPRKGKHAVDIHLTGIATPLHGSHTVVLGKVDGDLAWVVLDKFIRGPAVLRAYDPIQLLMKVPHDHQHAIRKVVICTRFHEML